MHSTQEGIAIAQLCIYSPIFLLTLVVVFYHGFARQSGWIYLALFCIVRIAGSAIKIESVSNPSDVDDQKWAAILQSVGLSPLLLASLGLLKRITDLVTNSVQSDPEAGRTVMPGGKLGKLVAKRATAVSLRSRIIQLAQIPIVIGLVLCILGGTDAKITFTKAGIVIFLIAFVGLIALVAVTVSDVGNAPRGENRLYWVIVTAIPFLGIRLSWSLIAVFGHDAKFSITGGDPWINFGMAVVEEWVIVFMYTITGLTLKGDELSK
jgi:hypothetical protein